MAELFFMCAKGLNTTGKRSGHVCANQTFPVGALRQVAAMRKVAH